MRRHKVSSISLEIEVKVQTAAMTCDACGVTSEVALTRTSSNDILLQSPRQWARSHSGARNPRIDLLRWTINGHQQCAATT